MTDDILMKMMAGQQVSQFDRSPIEEKAYRASIAFYGGLMEMLLVSGRETSAFRRGYEHAFQGRNEFFGNGGAYDTGFLAANV